MTTTVSHKKYRLFPVTVTWFNEEPVFEYDQKSMFHLVRQSVPLLDTGNAICLKEYTSQTSIVDLTQSEEQLWKSFNPKSCRYEIRKIMKMLDAGQNIQVKREDDLKAFLAIANAYIKLKRYDNPLTLNHLTRYLDNDQGDLFTIYKDNKLLGGNLYLRDGLSRVRLVYSFNNRFDNKENERISGPLMRYMHWHAITKVYKPEGIRKYDFGGVNLDREASTYGISKFKLSFGGQVVTEWNYIFVQNKLLYSIYSLLQKMKNLGGSPVL